MKKKCGVNQYGAPPMDRLKDGQAGAPAAVPMRALATAAVAQGTAAPVTVPAGVPTMATTSKSPTAPKTGLAGALAPATMKGGPAGGWPATVPAIMPMGVPTAAAAAKERVAMKGGLTRGWGRTTPVAMAAAKAVGVDLGQNDSPRPYLGPNKRLGRIWAETSGLDLG
jgi:hypothetical protein